MSKRVNNRKGSGRSHNGKVRNPRSPKWNSFIKRVEWARRVRNEILAQKEERTRKAQEELEAKYIMDAKPS